MGIPEGEERAKRTENVFEEIMAENSTNLKMKIDIDKSIQGVTYPPASVFPLVSRNFA